MGDEEEDAAMGATKYPVMPSLVALQLMRSRYHLAQLGKKLMKWTALATGKELRKLSMDISALMDGYKEKWRTAFILLARARYFMPVMNTTILEGVSESATVTIVSTPRSIAGVKVQNYSLREEESESFPFLGIGQGGEVIKEAKEAWLELLRMMVMLSQYRDTFTLLDLANRNATKNQNELSRCVIPRILNRMRCIMSELHEQERGESFRLKLFKQLKYKNAGPDKRMKDQDEDENEPRKLELKPKPQPEVELKPEPIPKLGPKREPNPVPILAPIVMPQPPIIDPLELLMNHIIEVVGLTEKLETEPATPEKEFGLTICDLGKLNVQLEKLIEVSEGPIKDRVCSKCGIIGRTVSSCSCQMKLEAPKPAQTGDLRTPKPDGFVTAMKLMPKSKVKTTIPEYILNSRSIPMVDPMAASKPLDVKAMSKNRIEKLESHVDAVICMINRYHCEGLLSKSADFLKCCKSVKIKIQEFQYQKIVKAKLDRLKDRVMELEKITTIVQKEDLSAATVRSLMSCCTEFKAKLDELKSCKRTLSVGSENLLNNNDYNIVLSKEAKDKGLVSESGEEFISCVEIKTKIQPHNEPKPQVIDDLLNYTDLNDIISYLTKYKDGAFISNSVAIFYQNCQTTKAKIDSYEAGPPAGCGKSTCPKTPPKTPPPESRGSFTKARSHVPSVNSCSAGASVSIQDTVTSFPCKASSHMPSVNSSVSGQGTVTTCSGQSTVSQQSQHSCKLKYAEDSAPPPLCTEHTCVHKQPLTRSCSFESYQIAPPEKSAENGLNLFAVFRSTSAPKVIIVPKEKKKKKVQKADQNENRTTTVRTVYRKPDGSIVEETKTITVITEHRVYDGRNPPSNTSSWASFASTGKPCACACCSKAAVKDQPVSTKCPKK